MEHYQYMERQKLEPPTYIEMVHKLNQAIFYCYNESSERLPVGMVRDFTFKNNNTLLFSQAIYLFLSQKLRIYLSFFY